MRVFLNWFSLALPLTALFLIQPAMGAESWQAEWDKTVKAARNEGRVTVYGAATQGFLALNAGVFQKRFPEIQVVTVGGDRTHPRIMAERRAGKYLADVVVGGTSTTYALYLARALDPLRDAMILPEVLDESKWWRGRHHFTGLLPG
jgi:hypothetical protein